MILYTNGYKNRQMFKENFDALLNEIFLLPVASTLEQQN